LRNQRNIQHLFAVVATCALLLSGATAANASAPSPDSTATAAESVFMSVLNSPDQATALKKLSAQDRILFDLWTTPVVSKITTTIVTPKSQPLAAIAATTCSSWTQRGQFNNQLGQKLGSFYTTGTACKSASTMTTATFTDGGGSTSALGWSYTGKTTGQGIINNVSYIYGAYKFKLNIAGVDVQQPTYCARARISPVVATGDFTCGLG
jgi:hypothetical protein